MNKFISALLIASWIFGAGALGFAQSGTCSGMRLGQGANLNGFVPFLSSSLWNTDISNAPVDPNSANIINFIGATVTLHPDFGAGKYQNKTIGIPYQIVAGTQAKVPIIYGLYPDESDPGPYPIPSNALIEGYPKPGNGDHYRAMTHEPADSTLVKRAFTLPLAKKRNASQINGFEGAM